MKILVLGSQGFIGSNLVSFFKKLQYEVFEGDITLKESPNYFLINPELPDFTFIFSQQQFDVCINATGAANVQLSFKHPVLDYALNTSNVYYMLDAIRKYNPECKFINLSSAAVYGNPKQLPVKETDEIQPLSPYGFHKWYSEQIGKQFYSLYNIPTVSLRIFSAYGEGLKKQLFWDVFQKIKTAQKSTNQIEVFGTGDESRDFINIIDICKAVEIVIHKANFTGEAINVANGEEILIRDAIQSFVSQIDNNIEVSFSGDVKKGDPLNWRADIGHLELLGFRAAINFSTGVNNLVQWLKGQA